MNGTNFSTVTGFGLNVTPTGTPSLAVVNNTIMVAFRSGNGIYVCQLNGSACNNQTQVGLGYVAISSPSLTAFNGNLALVWLTTNGNPVVALFSPSNLASPYSVTTTTGVALGGDPSSVVINNSLFIFGRSFYSADNLWAIGTNDGVTFAPQHQYGQTLTNSPSVVYNPASGYFTQAGRSNYGSNIWAYAGNY